MTDGVWERIERLLVGRTIWARFLLEIVEITRVNFWVDREGAESLLVQVKRLT